MAPSTVRASGILLSTDIELPLFLDDVLTGRAREQGGPGGNPGTRAQVPTSRENSEGPSCSATARGPVVRAISSTAATTPVVGTRGAPHHRPRRAAGLTP